MKKQENTLLYSLQKQLPDCSINKLKKLIASNRVIVNGKLVNKPHIIIHSTDTVQLEHKKQIAPGNIKILYEDPHVIVIDKPAGLLSVKTNFEPYHHAHGILKRFFPNRKIIPVHRLDQDTSGVMVFVCNESIKDEIKNQFFHHTIYREYLAVVHGHPPLKKGSLEHYLIDTDKYVTKVSNSQEGKKAITHYELIKQRKNTSLVRFVLETGRKNQIRVVAAYEGFPIVGDKKYGSCNDFSNRLYLHAHTLRFFHPILKKTKQFSSNYPWE